MLPSLKLRYQIILRVSSLSNIAKNKSKAIKTGKNVIESRQSTFENRTMNKGFKQTIENSLIKLFHFLVASHFFYSLYYDFTYVLPKEIPLRNYSFGSKLVYLTVLNAILQSIYFTIALINDFIGTNDCCILKRPWIRKCKDFIFASLAFPLALDVTIVFWSMYFYDRESVLPEKFQHIFPAWLNHAVHTNITIFILIELFIVHRKYPKRAAGLTTLAGFLIAYIIWMFITRHFAGKWAYPLLDELNHAEKAGFFLFAGTFPVWMYFLGEYLNSKIWSKTRIALKCMLMSNT